MSNRQSESPAGAGGAGDTGTVRDIGVHYHSTTHQAGCQPPDPLVVHQLARLLAGATDVNSDSLRLAFPDIPLGDNGRSKPDLAAVREWLKKRPDLARAVLATDPATPVREKEIPDIPELPDEARLPASLENEAMEAGQWLNNYLRYATQKSPSTPELFHESAALFVGGLAIARRLYVALGHGEVWPNLYVMWIAPTTLYAKSSGLRILSDLVDMTMPHMRLACEFTPEALLTDLAGHEPVGLQNRPEEVRQLWQAARNYAAQRGIILDEASALFSGFKRDYLTGLPELLLHLYEAPRQYTRNTRGAGYIVVRAAFLSFIGATTPTSLISANVDTAWYTGMFARFALLTPDSPPVYALTDIRPDPPVTLVETLRRLHAEKLPVPTYPDIPQARSVALDPEAYESWKRYDKALRYDLLNSSNAPDGRLWGCYGRMPTQAIKIALILAALDWAEGILDEPRITLAHWARGQMIAEKWRASAHRFLDMLYATPPGRDFSQRIVILLQRAGEAGLTKREIRRKTGLPGEVIEQILSELAEDGLVITMTRKSERGPATIVYRWVGNGGETCQLVNPSTRHTH